MTNAMAAKMAPIRVKSFNVEGRGKRRAVWPPMREAQRANSSSRVYSQNILCRLRPKEGTKEGANARPRRRLRSKVRERGGL